MRSSTRPSTTSGPRGRTCCVPTPPSAPPPTRSGCRRGSPWIRGPVSTGPPQTSPVERGLLAEEPALDRALRGAAEVVLARACAQTVAVGRALSRLEKLSGLRALLLPTTALGPTRLA